MAQSRGRTAFLQRYGYLQPPSELESAGDAVAEESLAVAIARYQRMHSLPETGVVDAETDRYMATPRCGVPDIDRTAGLESLADPSRGWGRRDITFALDLTTAVPSIGASAFENEVGIALAMWADAAGLRFSPAFPADIFFGFRFGDHGDGHPSLSFDGVTGGTLGHAFPPRHPRLSGHVHLDAAERWSIVLPAAGSADLPTLLLHEIGHALGLEHDTGDPSAVMNERFEIGATRRSLGASDIEAVRAVYV
jgi:hypothetical protein